MNDAGEKQLETTCGSVKTTYHSHWHSLLVTRRDLKPRFKPTLNYTFSYCALIRTDNRVVIIVTHYYLHRYPHFYLTDMTYYAHHRIIGVLDKRSGPS